MNCKYLALLILFLFNVSATVVADSEHFDIPGHASSTLSHSHTGEEHAADHPADHHSCHHNHIHHYLLPLASTAIYVASVDYTFPDYINSQASIYLEIIKPPLV